MKTYPLILLTVLFLGWLGCTREPENLTDTGSLKSGKLKFGDTIIIPYHSTLYDEQNNLSLTFDTVLTDCRCPEGCLCCWQGYVQVGLTFSVGSQLYPFAIDSYFTPDTALENYHFHLVDVTPYPTIEQDIEITDYSVLLVVTQ